MTENWKNIGTLLTGVAALITAFIPIASYFYDTNKQNLERINQITAAGSIITKQPQYALISDPDGWVNVRNKPSSDSSVLFKIENNYRVELLERVNNWYKIKTSTEEVGYVYFDRLILTKK